MPSLPPSGLYVERRMQLRPSVKRWVSSFVYRPLVGKWRRMASSKTRSWVTFCVVKIDIVVK